jgi:large subunit ribosomal protein L23
MATVTDPRDIILAPVISEKSFSLVDDNVYTFLVHPDSNKTQIKIAIEKIFSVKVAAVNTANRRGKLRRTRSGYGKRKNTKRAIVTLTPGSKSIDLFGTPE